MTEAELRKLEMENARKFRAEDQEELSRPEIEKFRLLSFLPYIALLLLYIPNSTKIPVS